MIWKKSEYEEATATPPPQPQPPEAPAARPQPQPTKERALIGPSIEIKGNLTGGEDLLIEGKIDGKIELQQHSLTIGKSGRVKADISGRSIVVLGEVEGSLFAEEQIVLRQASTVRGNLFAPRVTLEDGSNFKGTIDMTSRVAEAGRTQAAGPELRPTPQIQRREASAEKS